MSKEKTIEYIPVKAIDLPYGQLAIDKEGRVLYMSRNAKDGSLVIVQLFSNEEGAEDFMLGLEVLLVEGEDMVPYEPTTKPTLH